jgi:uncharacterized membrane protein
MATYDAPSGTTLSPTRGLIEYTHWIYGLHALSVLIGLVTAHSIATRFAFGLPSIIAVIMNYARRSDARGTWLESHFRWQIRTFWFSWLWIVVVSLLALPFLIIFVGFVLAYVGLGIVGLWVCYRVIRGWIALRDGVPMPMPAG